MLVSLSELAGSTVLVTGAGGLIGSRLTAQLRQLGARTVSVCKMDAYPESTYRDYFGIRSDDPDFIVGDIAEPRLIKRLIPGCDYVVHAAALADVAACTRQPLDAIDSNVVGTQRVLDAVAASPTVRRMVFVSSASVYGNGDAGQPGARFREDAPVRPVSVYGASKVWGEHETAAVLGDAGTSYAIVRYFSVYGEPQVIKEHSHSWVVAWFAMRASLGLPLHLNGGGRQVRDFVHVDDIATGTLHALTAMRAHQATVNIGTGTGTSIRRLADLVCGHYPGVPLLETEMPPGDPEGGYACTRRMEDLLGWRPGISVEDGVARYVKWLHERPDVIPQWLREPTAA